VGLGGQLGQCVDGQPRQQAAAVLDRRVEQAAGHARLSCGGDELAWRQRPPRDAGGVGVRDGDHLGVAVDRFARGAQHRDGLVAGRRAPEPDLHRRGTGARRAERGQGGGARQRRQVADRGAERHVGRQHRRHRGDDPGRRRAQRSLGGVLDVDDVHAARHGELRLGRVGHAHQQPHARSTLAP
jgi:hypothetical protein